MAKGEFYHALKIDKEKCIGCVHCIRVCPTQALRVIRGKATLFGRRCVDCGECMRACLEIVTGETGLDKEVAGGYTSDLLSDVMGNSREGQVWITMQTHMNVIAVATLKDHAAVIFVSGNRPAPEVKEKAVAEGVTLLATRDEAFIISGKIYTLIME